MSCPDWLTADWLQEFSCFEFSSETMGYPLIRTTGRTWGTAPRALDNGLFFSLLSGDAYLHYGEMVQRLTSDQIVIIPAGTHYHLSAGSRPQRRHIRFRFTHPPVGSDAAPLIIHEARSQQFLIKQLVEVVRKGDDRIAHVRFRALMSLLLSSPLSDGTPSTGGVFTQDQRLAIEDWCVDTIRDQPSGADLARHLGMSHDYATRIFRASYGLPPRRWLLQQRLVHIAVELAESSMSLAEIAAEYGYSSQTLLGRQFKEMYGVTPSAYRRHCRSM